MKFFLWGLTLFFLGQFAGAQPLLVPIVATEPPISEAIFNPELSREFRQSYRDTFGLIDTEGLHYQPGRALVFNDDRSQDVKMQAEIDKRRTYAEYMIKRLTEWHLDHYIRTDPKMRPVYVVKETISHVHVEVTPQTKFDIRYNLASNIMDLDYLNPWITSRLSYEMNPRAFGPTEPLETRLRLGKALTKKLYAQSVFSFKDGINYSELARFWKGNVSTSIGVSSYFHETGTSTRETRYTVGFSHAY